MNFLGAEVVSKTESFVVAVKLLILAMVVAFGIGGIDTAQLQPSTWGSPSGIAGAGMIIFVAYEGFELIANTSANVRNPATTLPRAYYTSVIFVIVLYVLISAVVVGGLSADRIAGAQDFALAEASKPSLGAFGFTAVGVAALLATLSAINSTLYGAARLSYSIAVEGELPEDLEKAIWHQPVGLLITASGALLLANTVQLDAISTMASASFLMIFGLVNLACVVKAEKARASRVVGGLGVIACVLALGSLLWHTFTNTPTTVWGLAGMVAATFVCEGVFRIVRARRKGDHA